MGWNRVHEEILSSPFCHHKQQIVKIAVSPSFQHPFEKNTCHSCLEEEGLIHEVTMRQPFFNERDFVKNFKDKYKRIFKVVLPGCLIIDDEE